MALKKQAVAINFTQGLDKKTDPYQMPFGRFESLVNSVFDTVGALRKRNGFPQITALPDSSNRYLTTYNDGLVAIGDNFNILSADSNIWLNRGSLSPISLKTTSLIQNNYNQFQADAAFSPNGLVCVAYSEQQEASPATVAVYKYAILDATTGESVVAPTLIASSAGSVVFSPRVFSLRNYFTVLFSVSSGSGYRLQYIPINSVNPSTATSPVDLTTDYEPFTTSAFDGVVANDSLYLSWNRSGTAGVKSKVLNQNFAQSAEVVIASTTASIVAVTADVSAVTPIIWTSTYISGSNSGVIVATNSVAGSGSSLSTLFSAKQYVNSSTATVSALSPVAQGGLMRLYYQVFNNYSYTASTRSDYLNSATINTIGSLSATGTVIRSMGLASKQFLIGSNNYFLSIYKSDNQSTYFLLNSAGGVAAKFAYGNANGFGYYSNGLPNATVAGGMVRIPFLQRGTVQAVNKDTDVTVGTAVNGIYSQTGVSIVSLEFTAANITTTEIGGNLNISGALTTMYDGVQPVEQGFNLYPDYVSVSSSGFTGSVSAQTYFYRSTYEWNDNQGNIFRSAPSIPAKIVVSSGSSSRNLINVPNLKATYKITNPVKICLYRWSTAQPTYYQTTSLTTPVINNPANDFVTIQDPNSDAAILGNNILYTEGGVLESIGAPASGAMTLFDNRMWVISAESPDVLWYSKPVLQNTPVEMSDLQTIYVSPTSGAQGPTGPCLCLAPMDDKLIIFKKNALYYINGLGPDATGANSQYSEPVFIAGTVGCSNQNSIVMTPNGLMFQSDKGIWLLGRDLSTTYIGNDVESFNNEVVLSALAIPGTNQVRFMLDSGNTLMYDYFVDQWGVFAGIPGVSSTLYQDMHTYVDRYGRVFQEQEGSYLDGSKPVVMSFKTGWINLAGLQGYGRIYSTFLLAKYLSPHKFSFGIAYDFNPAISQLINVSPTNWSGTWGSSSTWGSVSLFGGPSTKEQWQINFARQNCQSFQLTFSEQYDSTKGVVSGPGLRMSGLNMVVGLKKGYPINIGASNKVG